MTREPWIAMLGGGAMGGITAGVLGQIFWPNAPSGWVITIAIASIVIGAIAGLLFDA